MRDSTAWLGVLVAINLIVAASLLQGVRQVWTQATDAVAIVVARR
jgi:hypothetical protein